MLNCRQEEVGCANGSTLGVFGGWKDKALLAAVVWTNVEITLVSKA